MMNKIHKIIILIICFFILVSGSMITIVNIKKSTTKQVNFLFNYLNKPPLKNAEFYFTKNIEIIKLPFGEYYKIRIPFDETLNIAYMSNSYNEKDSKILINFNVDKLVKDQFTIIASFLQYPITQNVFDTKVILTSLNSKIICNPVISSLTGDNGLSYINVTSSNDTCSNNKNISLYYLWFKHNISAECAKECYDTYDKLQFALNNNAIIFIEIEVYLNK